jgi:hypothetical protein
MRIFPGRLRWPRCSRARSAASNPASCVSWRTRPMTSPGEEYGHMATATTADAVVVTAGASLRTSAAGVQETFRLCHERQSQLKADQLAASPCRRPGAQLGVSVRLGGSVGLHKVLSAELRNRRS